MSYYGYKDLFKKFINNLRPTDKKFSEKNNCSLVTTNNRQMLHAGNKLSFLNSQFNNSSV